MCFNLDYDWTCEDSVHTTLTAEKPVKCCECCRLIPAGGTIHHLHMQECETCHTCSEGECECPGKDTDEFSHDCACAEPDFGNTYDGDTCEDCHHFLEAVEKAEVAAGCSPHESRPHLTQMIEMIGESGPEEAEKYFTMFLTLHPERKEYAGWLWAKMFKEAKLWENL